MSFYKIVECITICLQSKTPEIDINAIRDTCFPLAISLWLIGGLPRKL